MAVPSWKMAIIARRKQQEDEERRKKAEMDAYLASLPPWKRAMKLKQLEKEGKAAEAQPMPVPSTEPPPVHTASKPPALSKWKAVEEKSKAVESSSHQPHPALSPKQSHRLSGSKPRALSRWKEVEEKSMTVEAFESHSDSAAATTTHKHPTSFKPLAQSKWKDSEPHPDTDDSGQQAISQTPSPRPPPPTRTATEPSESTHSSTKSEDTSSSPTAQAKPTHEIFRDPSFLAQPKWKQDLILKKRGIKRPSAGDHKKPTSSSPAAVQPEKNVKPPQEPVKRVEVVNASTNITESSKPEKLVSVEGKLHRPPVFQEVDEWAHVDDLESNHKFKNLPLWHQALIKRKRDKRVLRSQPQESTAKTDQAEDKEKRPEVFTPWAPLQTHVTSTMALDSQSKPAPSEDFQPVSSSKPAKEENSGIPSWLAEVRARKQHSQQASKSSQLPRHTSAPALVTPSTPAPITSTKTGPLKSSPPCNTSSLVRSPSDLSDSASDLECTLIDDLSDEEEEKKEDLMSSISSVQQDSGPVRSILKGSTSERRMRKVVFSDSQLTTEHVYPRYTYDDYFEIEQPVPESPDGLATPVHPWVSGSSSASSSTAKQPPKTLDTNYLSSFSNTTFDSVLAAYAFNKPPVSSTRGGVTSPTSSNTTGSRNSSTSSLGSDADMYNLSNDTAALIW